MPAFTEVQTAPQLELTGQKAVVTSLVANDGASPFEFAEVLKIKHSSGITPGKAWISIRNLSANDENTNTGSHITLNTSGPLSPTSLKYWSRIKITVNGVCLFIGALMKRRDFLGQEAITLEYWDDRWLLRGIPVRGCFVYDNYTGNVVFLPRYMAETNPGGGYKNCTRAGKNSESYVFSELAEALTQTICNDVASGNDSDVDPGESIIFTPERFLKYLNYLATSPAPAARQGFNNGNSPYAANWSTLDQTKLLWTPSSCQFKTGSYMRNGMPNTTFRGQSVLSAIIKTLDIAGDYRLGIDYSSGKTSSVEFYPFDRNVAGTRKVVYLQRNGNAADIKTMFDGTVETDASEFSTGVLVEAAPIKIETQWTYGNKTLDTLQPAWLTAERDAFLMIIATGYQVTINVDDNGNTTYTQGDLIPGATALQGAAANITTGKYTGLLKSSFANTTPAVNMARLSFPKVYRAFQIQDSVAGAQIYLWMGGAAGQYSAFPILLDFRTPLQEQLQPYFETSTTKRGRLRIPMRVQVSDIDVSQVDSNGARLTPKYHDVVYNNGLRVTDDGLIWFDGLTDDLTLTDAIYSQTLQLYKGATSDGTATGTPTDLPQLKYIKLNAAVNHDVRLSASVDVSVGAPGETQADGSIANANDPNSVYDQIDASLLPSPGAGISLCHYILNPEAYTQEHQVTSFPAADGSFRTSDGKSPPKLVALTTPCTKVIYDDSLQIAAHATRQQKDHCRLKRTASYKFPGIRADFAVGDFFEKIQLVNASSNIGEVKVDAAADAVTFDFEHQESVLETD